MTGTPGSARVSGLKANPIAEPSEMIRTTSKTSQPVPTVIVSRPGIMQRSLRSSLAACGGITVIATSGDGLMALRQVTQHRPGMLVIDSNLLDEEVEALLAGAKTEHPAIRCLVFVRSSQQEAQVLALGADAVARRDGSAQQLQAALARLAQAARGPQA